VCAGAGGEVVIRVRAEAATLAFTGSSSNTPTYVLIGIAAIVLGLVMVVGVRRRASVRG
jgi:LPXTG-motif cell wall-anchored protein